MQLAALLDEAQAATPDRRIEWRDRIAPFGARAIQAVAPWLERPHLAAFAVRVIARAGEDGEIDLAARTLRAARRDASGTIRDDIDWALARLRTAAHKTTAAPATRTVRVSRVVRERPFFTPVARRRTR